VTKIALTLIHRMANDPSHEWYDTANEMLNALAQAGYGVAGRELELPKHGFSPMAGGGTEVGRPQTQARGTIPSHPDEQKRIGMQNNVEKSLLKLMKVEEPRSRQAMETEFPVRHPEGSYDPSIRVSRRSSMDRPTTPDPTQPLTVGEGKQQDYEEARDSERSRGGIESGIYGVRRNNPGLGRRRTDENASGQPNYRKIPIGKTDMEKGGTFYGGTRKQDVPQSLPKTKPSWGRKENEAAKQAGVERSIARLRTPRNWYSSDQGRGNIGDTRGQRKKSIEKTPVEGQGTSDPAGVFDASKPMPRPKVTGPDHPEGPGKRLINGFTVKEHDDMETADKRGVMRPGYPQDPDARPAYPQQPKPRVRKPYLRPSRAKKSIENSLLKLMKADEADVTIGGGGPGKEPKFKPMPPIPSSMMDITNPKILDHGAYDEQTGEGSHLQRAKQ